MDHGFGGKESQGIQAFVRQGFYPRAPQRARRGHFPGRGKDKGDAAPHHRLGVKESQEIQALARFWCVAASSIAAVKPAASQWHRSIGGCNQR